ncbi:MAG TPA: hypothetical protein VK511_05195 [Gemmatimonadaceae bacterium]|nr:hypothetical protein [Gemmatimonadaceae bacterium]
MAFALAVTACGGDGAAGPGTHTPPQTTAVGTPTGAAASQTIGPTGGSLTSGDGKLKVTIPAGALATATDVTIEPITALAPWALGPAYRLGPAGLTFANPVSIAFHYDDSQLVGTAPQLLWIVSQDSTGAWPYASAVTLDTTAKVLTVQSTHFSDWSLVPGLQIRPPSAEVDPGAHVALTIGLCLGGAIGYDCDETTSPDDEELPALPPGIGGLDVTSWAVNGVARGSATYGFVDGSFVGADYVAPSDAPDDQNPVAVSVRVLDHNGHTISTLVSNIKVRGTAPTYHATGAMTLDSVQIALLVVARVTDRLEFDFTKNNDGSLTISNITNSPSEYTNPIIPAPEGPNFCKFTVDSPFEFGTFEEFNGAALPSGTIQLLFSGDGTLAASTYYIKDDNGACSVAEVQPGGDDPVLATELDIDPTLFPHVGSDVVVLGSSVDQNINGWVFDIRRTK